jgi:hypothetical protein
MADPWYINGDYIIACSCDYVCPCNFGLLPKRTRDDGVDNFCAGCSLVRINDGRYGKIALNGLNCGFASFWPGPIYEAGGVVSFYIDQAAGGGGDPRHDALAEIIKGNAGGPLFPILASTYSPDKMSGPHSVPFKITLAGEETSADVGALVDGEGDRVHMVFQTIQVGTRNVYPTVVSSEAYQVGGDLYQYALKEFSVKDATLDPIPLDPPLPFNFNGQDRCAQHARVSWRGP